MKTSSHIGHVATLLLLISGVPASADEKLNWHAELGSGFEAALWLNTANRDGVKSGSFFWMFKERDITWTETKEGYEVTYKRPWSEDSSISETARFERDADSGSLKLDVSELTAEEKTALGDVVWKRGGETPGNLGSFRVQDSPYSRYHERGDFIYDVNKAPAPLVRYAMRVFKEDNRFSPKLLVHRDLKAGTLAEAYALALSPEVAAMSESQIYRSSILRALASNPSTPYDILEKMWSRPPQIWESDLPYLLSIHPKANPAWRGEVIALIKDKENGVFLRSSLASRQPLPEKIVDLLIETSDYHSAGGLTSLAFRKDLTADQITRIMREHPWTLGEHLIERPDLPAEAWNAALVPDSWELLTGILENPEAPRAIARKTLEAIISNEKHHHVREFCAGLATVASHPLLNREEQILLASHPALEVRAALAKNPSLAADLLGKLAEDPYAIIAKEARQRIGKNDESWELLEDLSPAHTTYAAFNEASGEDNVEMVLKLAHVLMTHRSNGAPLAEAAITKQSMRSIRAMIEAGMWTKAKIAAYAGKPVWTEEMSEFVLSGEPTQDVITAFALSVAQTGTSKDLEPLRKRAIRLGEVKTTALVWFAVARRDIDLLRTLKNLDAPMDVPYDGFTPVQLAVRLRLTEAIEFLPMDEKSKAELEAFRKRFPGDPNAPWLGAWTNGLDEFKTLNMVINAAGTGNLFPAIGMAIPVAWLSTGEGRFNVHVIGENNAGQETVFGASYANGEITLDLGEKKELLKRPQPEK